MHKIIYLTISIFLLFQSGGFAQEKLSEIDGDFLFLKDSTLLESGGFTVKMKMVLYREFYDSNGMLIPYHKIRFAKLEGKLYGIIGNNVVRTRSKGEVKFFYIGDRHYYAKDFGYIKTISYGSLYSDLVINQAYEDEYDREVIRKKLDRGRAIEDYRITAGIGGVGSVLVGGFALTSRFFLIKLVGAGFFAAGFITAVSAMLANHERSYISAIKYYNRIDF